MADEKNKWTLKDELLSRLTEEQKALIEYCAHPDVEDIVNSDVSCSDCRVFTFFKEHDSTLTHLIDFYKDKKTPQFPCYNGSNCSDVLAYAGLDILDAEQSRRIYDFCF